MATDKKRIQAYLSKKIYKSLQNYSDENNRSVSSSVEFLLSQTLLSQALTSLRKSYISDSQKRAILSNSDWNRP